MYFHQPFGGLLREPEPSTCEAVQHAANDSGTEGNKQHTRDEAMKGAHCPPRRNESNFTPFPFCRRHAAVQLVAGVPGTTHGITAAAGIVHMKGGLRCGGKVAVSSEIVVVVACVVGLT